MSHICSKSITVVCWLYDIETSGTISIRKLIAHDLVYSTLCNGVIFFLPVVGHCWVDAILKSILKLGLEYAADFKGTC